MKHIPLFQQCWRLFCLCLIGSCLQSCSPDFLESNPGQKAPEQGVISMSYEAEVLTYQPLGSKDSAPAIDRITAMAKSARTRISVEIYKDGTSDWTMEKLTPKRNTLMKDLTPPDPSPQTQKTRITRDGLGYFYSADGKLLHKDPVPVGSFTPMLIRLKKDPTAINKVVGLKSVQEIMTLVATAKDQGGIVQDLGNNIISIRSSVQSSNPQARKSVATYKQVDILHTKLGLVLGSSLYNEADELVCQTYYRYKKGSDNSTLVPGVIYTKQWDTNSRTKQRVETINNTEIENIIIKNNQG